MSVEIGREPRERRVMTASEGTRVGGHIRVVAAVIEREGHYLIGCRPGHKRHGGLWEFPGGKLLDGESLADAARRELEEELGLIAEDVGAKLFEKVDEDSPFQIEFVQVVASGKEQALEHTELRWVSPEEMLEMPLAPSDALFAAFLCTGGEEDG